MHPGGEGRDRRADRRLPVHRRLRQDAVPAGAPRHRRAPRRACCRSTAGWWRRSPRPGCSRSSAAPTPSASASTCRSAPCCSPALSKYDGARTRLLKAREFHQIAGRAGRAGFDTVGTVVVQAPEHVIENERRSPRRATTRRSAARSCARSRRRASSAGASRRFERLVDAEPEPLTSSFAVSHAMLLNVIGRPGDAFAAMRHLLDRQPRGPRPRSAGTSAGRSRSTGRCWPAAWSSGSTEPDAEGRRVRLTVDLQLDFALNQPLSPFALAAIELLDRDVAGLPAGRRCR